MAITEMWIEQGQEWLLEVPGFRCFSKIREGGKRGGGVVLLIKDSITAAERQFEEDLTTEVVWAEVRNRKGAVTLLGVFYRPPNSNRDVEEKIAKQILDRCGSHRVVVMGDFNFPNIDWNLYNSNSLDGVSFCPVCAGGFPDTICG